MFNKDEQKSLNFVFEGLESQENKLTAANLVRYLDVLLTLAENNLTPDMKNVSDLHNMYCALEKKLGKRIITTGIQRLNAAEESSFALVVLLKANQTGNSPRVLSSKT